MYLLSECEPSSWHSDSINELLKLLSGLICSYLEHPGCPQQAGPYWANGKVQEVLGSDLLSAPTPHTRHALSIINRHDATFCCFFISLNSQQRADSSATSQSF